MNLRQICIFTITLACAFITNGSNISGTDGSLEKKIIKSSPSVQWKQIGPGQGGSAYGFFINPHNSKQIFYSSDMGCTYKSEDGGDNFTPVTGGDNNYKSVVNKMQDMAFCKKNKKLIYTGGNRKIFKSMDSGNTWINITPYKLFPKLVPKVGAIAYDKDNEAIVYAGFGYKYWRKYKRLKLNEKFKDRRGNSPFPVIFSTNSGKSWKKAKGIPANTQIYRIIVDPRKSKDLVYATTNLGIFTSADKGQSWEKMSTSGFPHLDCAEMDYYYDKQKGEFILYVLLWTRYSTDNSVLKFHGGIYKSPDNGKNWECISDKLNLKLTKSWLGRVKRSLKLPNHSAKSALQIFCSLKVHPTNKNIIFTGTARIATGLIAPWGIWQTIDGGKSWKICTVFNRSLNSAVKAAKNVDVDWVKFKVGTGQAVITRGHVLDIAKSEPNILFFSAGMATFKSIDCGKTWQQWDNHVISEGENSIEIIGRNTCNTGFKAAFFDYSDKNHVYLGAWDIGIWVTDNGGKTIKKYRQTLKNKSIRSNQVNLGGIHAVAVDPDDANIVYCGTSQWNGSGHFFVSKDKGKYFSYLSSPNYGKKTTHYGHINSIVIIPGNNKKKENLIFISGSSVFRQNQPSKKLGFGIKVSKDNGKTWSKRNNGLPSHINVQKLAYCKKTNELFCLVNSFKKDGSVSFSGLYSSKNYGKQWQCITKTLKIHASDFVVNKNNPDNIYIATVNTRLALGALKLHKLGKREKNPNGGLWVTYNKGKSWQRIFKANIVTAVELNPDDDAIYLANSYMVWDNITLNPGIFRSKDKGKTWEKINNGLAGNFNICSLKFNPYKKGELWAGSFGLGMYVTLVK
jgi:photosystem II stability/assembly factor-like uncharacterized protein